MSSRGHPDDHGASNPMLDEHGDPHPDHHEDPDSDEERAGHVGHHCTDICCCLLFIAAFVPLVMILKYANANGDVRKLHNGYNFLGQLCGVDYGCPNSAPNQTCGSYLYWCATGPATLDLQHPICVDACPTSTSSSHFCFLGSNRLTGPFMPNRTFQELTTYSFGQLTDYPSSVYMGGYCLPSNSTLMGQVFQQFQKSYSTKAIMGIAGVGNAWLPLLITAIIAVALGYAYLLILKLFAKILVYVCLTILCLAPLVSGIYLVSAYWTGGIDGMPGTGDAQYDMFIGLAALVFAMGFIVLTCCAKKSVDMAVGCVEAACECIFDMPTILLEPAVALASKLTVLVILGVGFMLLLSCGDVQKVSLQSYVASASPTGDVSGVFRTLRFTQQQLQYLAYYVFMFFWVAELFTALSQFVLSYSVQLWYFVPYVDGEKDAPWCPILKGYRIGLMYHLGTLAFGAFLIATLRFVRIILGYIAKQAKKTGNPAAACCAKACLCLVDCFKRGIEFLNKNAYMDVAITSSDFCTAARRALGIITAEIAAVSILNGACWIFQLAGVGAITGVGTYVTFLIVSNASYFSDPVSDHYVPDVVLVTAVAGGICMLVGVVFMVVFDTVADTILYCYAIEKKRRIKGTIDTSYEYAPQSLKALIHGGDA